MRFHTYIISTMYPTIFTQLVSCGPLSMASYPLQQGDHLVCKHKRCGYPPESTANNWLLFSFKPCFYNNLFSSWCFLRMLYILTGWRILVIRCLYFKRKQVEQMLAAVQLAVPHGRVVFTEQPLKNLNLWCETALFSVLTAFNACVPVFWKTSAIKPLERLDL